MIIRFLPGVVVWLLMGGAVRCGVAQVAPAAGGDSQPGFAAALLVQQLVLGLAVSGFLLLLVRRVGPWGRRPTNQPAPPVEGSQLAIIINTLDEGLLLLDENRRVLVANTCISCLLGLPVAELTGRPMEELARQRPLVAKLLPYLEVPAAQRPPAMPLVSIPQPSGEAHYQLLLTEVPLLSEAATSPAATGTLLTLRDVSDYRQLDQVKWRFLTTVSQELAYFRAAQHCLHPGAR
jgi:hypothetical protein